MFWGRQGDICDGCKRMGGKQGEVEGQRHSSGKGVAVRRGISSLAALGWVPNMVGQGRLRGGGKSTVGG